MSELFLYGGELVTRGELHRGAARGETKGVTEYMVSGGREPKFGARRGSVRSAAAFREAAANQPTSMSDFVLRVGSPLVVEVRQAYVGSFADRGFSNLGGKRDGVVCSATKSPFVSAAAPRAINFMVNDPTPRVTLRRVAATDVGTPIVYASPAMSDETLTITVEMTFDRFPKDLFDTVSGVLGTLGALPVFAAASAFLVAGSTIVRVAGEVGERLMDGSPSLKGTLSLDLDDLGGQDGMFMPFGLLVNDAFYDAARRDYTLDPDGRLVSKQNGAPYEGDEPYVSLRFSNRDRPEIRKFAPALLTAQLLSRFYHVRENQPTTSDLVKDAMGVFNDVVFRNRADELIRDLTSATAGSEEEARLRRLLEATLKNIQDPRLKPSI